MNVGVRELKARLSEYIDRVERGEIITVTHRGRGVAQLVPLPGRGNLEQGLREGWIVRAVDRPPGEAPSFEPRPGAPSSADVLRDDRDA